MRPKASTSTEKGFFPVAAKVLLCDGNKLLILHDVFGDWDLPGGRILPQEFGKDIREVIDRKIHQELGNGISYSIEETPETYFQVIRTERDTGSESYIFGIGFTALYLEGEINLGPHHDTYEWVDMDKFKPADYFSHGWEVGVRSYLQRQGFGQKTT